MKRQSLRFNRLPFGLLCLSMLLFFVNCKGQQKEPTKQQSSEIYTYKLGTPNGIGKWYLGREIAHVMGFQGMEWLNRP